MDSENQKNPAQESPSAAVPQTEYLRGLADIMREENLAELEVEQNGVRFTLRAVGADDYGLPVAPQVFYPAVAPQAVAPGMAQPAVAPIVPIAAAKEENLIEVVSPMVGVFYRAPSPADPNFIEIGDRVEAGQTVALVEAMKVFNEIVAETAGTVVEIKPQSSDLVETGQVIITLRA